MREVFDGVGVLDLEFGNPRGVERNVKYRYYYHMTPQ